MPAVSSWRSTKSLSSFCEEGFGGHRGWRREEQAKNGKASHRGHGGHREGIGGEVVGGFCGWRGVNYARGKHRTEVTEVGEGFGESLILESELLQAVLSKASHRGHRGHREGIRDCLYT